VAVPQQAMMRQTKLEAQGRRALVVEISEVLRSRAGSSSRRKAPRFKAVTVSVCAREGETQGRGASG